MRLSEIIQRCRELGEEDPEVNCDSVERAACVADGVVLVRDYDEDELRDDLVEWRHWDQYEKGQRLAALFRILRKHRLT